MNKRLFTAAAIALCVSFLSLPSAQAQADDAFLETGWIVWNITDPFGGSFFSTYDFDHFEAGGVETVEMRRWSNFGTLGWQITISAAYTYSTDGSNIYMSSSTGNQENHSILQFGDHFMYTQSGGSQYLWVDCQGASLYPNTWLPLAYNSTSSCRGF